MRTLISSVLAMLCVCAVIIVLHLTSDATDEPQQSDLPTGLSKSTVTLRRPMIDAEWGRAAGVGRLPLRQAPR